MRFINWAADLRYTRDTNDQWTLPPGSIVTIVQPAIEETLYRMGQLRAIYWSGYGEDHLERFGFDETDYRISFEIKKGGQMETNTIQFGKPSRLPPSLRLGHARRAAAHF